MNSLIDLNNQAAELIQHGYYSMSTKALRNALLSSTDSCAVDTATKHVTRCMDGSGVEQTQPDKTSPSVRPCTDANSIVTKGGEKASTALSHCRKARRRHSLLAEQCKSNGTDFVYRRPIYIPHDGVVRFDALMNCDCDGENEEVENGNTDGNDFETYRLSESDINCIILFNLALSYHLAALEIEEEDDLDRSSTHAPSSFISSGCFKKALIFYEMCFTLQIDLGVLTPPETLAVVNNCSTIYKRVGQTQRADRFYQHMLSSIMTIVEAGDTRKDEVEDLDGFLYNICSSGLILRDVAAPAA